LLPQTLSKSVCEYIKDLKEVVYASICTNSSHTPYPYKPGIEPTQYWFATKALPSRPNGLLLFMVC